MNQSLTVLQYKIVENQVTCEGYSFEDERNFDLFVSKEVAYRLNDEETTNELKSIAQGLALSGFETECLNEILISTTSENLDWAIGESLAEVWLTEFCSVIWPWNMARDKRNPLASLPGADLIGFIKNGSNSQFVFGEVKTSRDKNSPPNVLSGRSGMIHQIDNLATNLNLINTILRWLYVRCKNLGHEEMFRSSLKYFLSSGNKAVSLFGVLIRDIESNKNDLVSRSKDLSNRILSPTTCRLIALYIPCSITDLHEKVKGSIE